VSSLRGCTVIVLSGPGARSRQLQIPRGWPVWACLFSLLSVGGSLLVGRQARAWFDPAAQRPGITGPATRSEDDEREAQPLSPLRALVPVPASLALQAQQPRSRHQPRPHVDLPTKEAWTGEAAPSGELLLIDVNGAHSIRVRPFGDDGLPNQDAFGQLKEFMRCRRSGHAQDVNPRLVALLTKLAAHFDGAALHVISAHRLADDVVTRPSSQHTRGTATDIRIPGVSLERIAQAAHELGARGIGVYPLSRFVHIDVREQPYYWRDNGEGAVATRAPF